MSIPLTESSLWMNQEPHAPLLPDSVEKKPAFARVKGFYDHNKALGVLVSLKYLGRQNSEHRVTLDGCSTEEEPCLIETVNAISDKLEPILPYSVLCAFKNEQLETLQKSLRTHVDHDSVYLFDLEKRQSEMETELTLATKFNASLSADRASLTYSSTQFLCIESIVKEHLALLHNKFRHIYSFEGYSLRDDSNTFAARMVRVLAKDSPVSSVDGNSQTLNISLDDALVELYCSEKPLQSIDNALAKTASSCKSTLRVNDDTELNLKAGCYSFENRFYSPTNELMSFRACLKIILSTLKASMLTYKDSVDNLEGTANAIEEYLARTNDFMAFNSRESVTFGMLSMTMFKSKVVFTIHSTIFHWLETFIMEHEK